MKFLTFVFVATVLIACGKNQTDGNPGSPGASNVKEAQNKTMLGVWKRTALSEDGVAKAPFDPAFIYITASKLNLVMRARTKWETVLYKIDGNKFVIKSERGVEYKIEHAFDANAQTLVLKYSANGPDGGAAIVDQFSRATNEDKGKYPALLE